MKKMRKITTVLLALIMMVMMSQAAFAQDRTANGGDFIFDGTDLSWDEASGSIEEALSGLQPGDKVTIKISYQNDSDEKTDWYLRNEVLETLEDASNASGGGYSYKLTNHGKTGTLDIFDSNAVGGSDAYEPGGIAKGLKAATDATEMEDFFYIDTLEADEGGYTELTVGLDGESQANVYENTAAELQLEYAVEVEETEDVYKYIRKKVDTGDMTNIMLPAAVFAGALVLLVLTVLSYRKDRKDGEEA
ncbi:MAG: hypothetical protein IJJ06_07635 [Mogibacterium sp.]|nr:hypothetical protein [Mogibacterium sp.]